MLSTDDMYLHRIRRVLHRIRRAFRIKALSLLPFHKHKYTQVVICGIPRSGTSLMFNLISQLAVDMTPKFPMGKKPTKSSGYTKEMSGIGLLDIPGNFITKQPDDVFKIEQFIKSNVLKKQILFIVMHRDLRDILVSKHQWDDGKYYLGYDFKNNISGKVNHNRGLRHYLSALEGLENLPLSSEVKVEVVGYQQVANDPDILVEIFRNNGFNSKGVGYWVNHSKEDTVYEKNESASQELKPVMFKWKDQKHVERIISEFQENPDLLDDLVKYGYEDDEHWFDLFKRREAA